jgi:hypothetical protein
LAISSTTRQVVSLSAPRPPCSRDVRSAQSPASRSASNDSLGYRRSRSHSPARGPISRAASSVMRSFHFKWLRLALFVVLVTLSAGALAQNAKPSKIASPFSTTRSLATAPIYVGPMGIVTELRRLTVASSLRSNANPHLQSTLTRTAISSATEVSLLLGSPRFVSTLPTVEFFGCAGVISLVELPSER